MLKSYQLIKFLKEQKLIMAADLHCLYAIFPQY